MRWRRAQPDQWIRWWRIDAQTIVDRAHESALHSHVVRPEWKRQEALQAKDLVDPKNDAEDRGRVELIEVAAIATRRRTDCK
jgi:hypothetical protein